jgi:UDP-N-acetylglucosamine 1-carboxyvinyltransferase
MQTFKVTGGKVLNGTVVPQGSKNEALMVICAVLLTSGKSIIYNIPNILDTNTLMDVLKSLGVKINKCENGGVVFDTSELSLEGIETEIYRNTFKKIRGSVMIAAPLLARFGKVKIDKPGGDKIGRRKIDAHLLGFQDLGASIEYDNHDCTYTLKSKKLIGCNVLLEEASVTGTANIIMAASLASGTTTIYNSACEPHIQQLCTMLVSMGAKISGVGSNLLTIEGVEKLMPTVHKIKSDMLEVGSFIALSAMTMSEITIKDAGVDQLVPVINTFRKLGVSMSINGDDIILKPGKEHEIQNRFSNGLVTISDAPWPGFPADLISIALVVATQAHGTVLFHQKMYESRLFFVDSLIEMGAQIVLCDPHRATVIGLNRKQSLKATRMNSPDIRAGNALLIAALSAVGTSTIYNVDQIDRGYDQIDLKLKKLGADIERIQAK